MTTGRRRRTAHAAYRLIYRILIVASLLGAVIAQAASYVYDANGRLRSVTTASGDSAEYIYDALGNILSINTVPSGQLAIFAFTPNHGPVGQSVTIFGQGFSASAVVKFNGTTATYAFTSATQLVATVPAGATTGLISVQVGANTANSIDTFIVTSDSGGLPPTITSFSPAVAGVGASIGVVGSHFVTGAGSTTAGVNSYESVVTPVSDSQLNFPVSTLAGSGFVTVSTPYGTAQSPTPLIVVPSAIGASNVITTGSLTVDGPAQAFTINQSSKYAAATFKAVAGQWLSLQWSSWTPTTGATSVSVYDPNNRLIANALPPNTIRQGNESLHLPQIGATGIYTIFAAAVDSTDSFSMALESAASVAMDGASLTVPTTLPGQTKRVLVPINNGDDVGIGVGNLVLTNSGLGVPSAWLYKPDSAPFFFNAGLENTSPLLCNPSGCGLNVYHTPQGGVFSLLVAASPDQIRGPNETMSFTVTASHDAVAALVPDVASPVLSLKSGQVAKFTFSGTAASTVGLQVTGISPMPVPKTSTLTVLEPDGTLLTQISATTGYTFDLANLPLTGTYTLLADPGTGQATPSMQAMVISSTSAAVAVDGVSKSIATTVGGQYAYFDFTANAADNISIGIGSLALTATTRNDVLAAVYKPDGTRLGSTTDCVVTGCYISLPNVPQTGIYAVVVAPNSDPTAKMSFAATVSHDAVTALTANTPVTASLRSGQTGRFTFSGTAGASAALQVNSISTTPANSWVDLKVLNPDGSQLASISQVGSAYTFDLASLPVTGTYTLVAQPLNGTAASLQVMLIPSASAAVVVDGSAVAFPTSTAGQYVYFDFDANAGDNIGLGISSLVLTNSSSGTVNIRAYKPDGTIVSTINNSCSAPGCTYELSQAPMTGTYAVLLSPVDASTRMSFVATVSRDLTTSLSPNTSASAALRSGQEGQFTFSGTAGTAAALQVSAASTTPATAGIDLIVFKPDGNQLANVSQVGAGYTFNLANLPTTGTYTLVAQGHVGASASMQVMLIPSASAAVTIDGSTPTISTSTPGQYAYFDFSANAGDNIGLGFTNLTVSSGTSVNVHVYRPDGVAVVNSSCSVPACSFALASLAQTGVYGVTVSPPGGTVTMSFTATVSHDVAAALTSGSPYSLSIPRNGQSARLTFSATAATNATLQIAGIATSPANNVVYLYVNRPGGAQLAATNSPTGFTFNLTNLPDTGTYTLFVNPANAATATMTVTPTFQ